MIPTPNFGYFSGPFGSVLKNAPIPTHVVPESVREIIENHHLTQGVSAYEQLLANGSPDAPLQVAWDANLIRMVGHQIYERMSCIGACQSIGGGALAGMLDTVRNKVLDFALEIEAAAPEAGEATPGTRPVPPERVSQILNTNIMGGTAIVAGSAETVQLFQVTPGSLVELRASLAKLGVDESDRRELEQAIETDPKPVTAERLGGRVAG